MATNYGFEFLLVGVTKQVARHVDKGSHPKKHVGHDGDPGEKKDPRGRAKEQMLTPRASHLYDES